MATTCRPRSRLRWRRAVGDESQREAIRARLSERGWVPTDRVTISPARLTCERWMRGGENGPRRWSALGISWAGNVAGPSIEVDVPLNVAPERLREIAECCTPELPRLVEDENGD